MQRKFIYLIELLVCIVKIRAQKCLAGVCLQISGCLTFFVQDSNQYAAQTWSFAGKTLTGIYQKKNGEKWLSKTADNNYLELLMDYSLLPDVKTTENGGMRSILIRSDFNYPI